MILSTRQFQNRNYLFLLLTLINIVEITICIISSLCLEWYLIEYPLPSNPSVKYSEHFSLYHLIRQWGDNKIEKITFIKQSDYFYSNVFIVVGIHEFISLFTLIFILITVVLIYHNQENRILRKFNILFSTLLFLFQSISVFYFLRITSALLQENAGHCEGKYWCHTIYGSSGKHLWSPMSGYWFSLIAFGFSCFNLLISIYQFISIQNSISITPNTIEYPSIDFHPNIDFIKNIYNSNNNSYTNFNNQTQIQHHFSFKNNKNNKNTNSYKTVTYPSNYILNTNVENYNIETPLVLNIDIDNSNNV